MFATKLEQCQVASWQATSSIDAPSFTEGVKTLSPVPCGNSVRSAATRFALISRPRVSTPCQPLRPGERRGRESVRPTSVPDGPIASGIADRQKRENRVPRGRTGNILGNSRTCVDPGRPDRRGLCQPHHAPEPVACRLWVGMRNALAAQLTRYPTLNDADLLSSDVDAHLFTTEPYRFVLPRDLGPLEGTDTVATLVDGQLLSWYPSLTVAGLLYARQLREKLERSEP